MSKHDGFEEFKNYEPNPKEAARMQFDLTPGELAELREAEEIQYYEETLGVSHEVGMLMRDLNSNLENFGKLIEEMETNLKKAMNEKRITKE